MRPLRTAFVVLGKPRACGSPSRVPASILRRHQQRRGNRVLALANSGAVAETYRYDPFGTPHIYAPDSITPRTTSAIGVAPYFGGLRYRSDLARYESPARLYDPVAGLWHQPDPAGTVDSPFLYGFAAHDPANYIDPTGWGRTTNATGEGVRVDGPAHRVTRVDQFGDPLPSLRGPNRRASGRSESSPTQALRPFDRFGAYEWDGGEPESVWGGGIPRGLEPGIYVASRGLQGSNESLFDHAFVVIVPQSPASFADDPEFAFSGGAYTILSAGPSDGIGVAGSATLVPSAGNQSIDEATFLDPAIEIGFARVRPLAHFSDDDFAREVVSVFRSYPETPSPATGGHQYALVPSLSLGRHSRESFYRDHSSNSFAHGLIRAAGGRYPILVRGRIGYFRPGEMRPVPFSTP